VVIKSAYTESLWEWVFRGMVQLSQSGEASGSNPGLTIQKEEKLP
jgi:hypothetical protein